MRPPGPLSIPELEMIKTKKERLRMTNKKHPDRVAIVAEENEPGKLKTWLLTVFVGGRRVHICRYFGEHFGLFHAGRAGRTILRRELL